MNRYETPQVEVIEVEVEKGFADSPLDLDGNITGWDDQQGGSGEWVGW